MIGARWANAEVGGDRMPDHSAYAQDGIEVTVTKASKVLKVGERGIYHAKTVLPNLLTARLDRAQSPCRASAQSGAAGRD